MASEYDGSIRIKTEIDTSGIEDGADRIKTACDEIEKKTSHMSEQQAISIQKASASVRKQAEDVTKLSAKYQEQRQKVAQLNAELQETKNAKTPTKQFADLQTILERMELNLQNAEKAKQEFLARGFGEDYANQFSMVEKFAQRIPQIRAQMDEMIANGTAYVVPDTSKAESALANEQAKLANMEGQLAGKNQKLGLSFEELGFKTQKASGGTSGIKGVFSTLITSAQNAAGKLSSLGGKVKNLFSGLSKLGSSAKNVSGGFKSGLKNILQYGFALRSLYALVNKAKSAISTGLGNMTGYSGTLNDSINSMKNALARLQNAFGAAFAPIVNVVAPIITQFVNMLATAINYVGAFFAALTGQKTYTAAKAYSAVASGASDAADATEAAAKANEGYLSGLDEISRFETPDSSGSGSGSGGSGSGGSDAGDMFETREIEGFVSDFADKVKEAWEAVDFTEIGTIVGEKLKAALDSIDWTGIQTVAQKVGKSLATFINGAVEVAGLGDSIGKTIAEAINTAILGIESFATNLHFDSIGSFIADGINGALTNIKWANAINAADAIGSGIADALNEVITPETFGNIGTTLGNTLTTVITAASSFVSNVNWKQWGEAVASGVNNYFDSVSWASLGVTFSTAASGLLDSFSSAISNTNWKMVGYNIGTAISNIDWTTILKSAANLVASTFTGLLDFSTGVVTKLFGSDFDNYVYNLDQATEKLQKQVDLADSWKNAGSEYDYASDLADKYFDLAEKANKTNEETETMKSLAGELVETLPELKTYYNTETGLLDTTRDSVDSLIASLKEKAKTEAAQEALKEYYEAQMNAKLAIEETKSAIKDTNDEYERLKKIWDNMNKLDQDYDATQQDGIYAQMKAAKDQLDQLNGSLDENQQLYDKAGQKIAEVTSYLKDYQTETDTANSKTSSLTKQLQSLSDKSLNTISITMKGGDVSIADKISVIAEVTGVDVSKLPYSEKGINDMYAKVTQAYANSGLTLSVPTLASSLNANGKNMYSGFYANSMSNNGHNMSSGFYANWLSNNGKEMSGAFKATSISNNAGKLSAAVKISSYSNKPTVTTKVKVAGYTGRIPTLSARVLATRISRKTGGVYENGTWHNIPQYASGGEPNHGTVFVAGEAGAEVVGHIGGRTEVLNQSQIASAIYTAVRQGMAEAVNNLASYITNFMATCTNAQISAVLSLPESIARCANISASTPSMPYLASGTVVPPSSSVVSSKQDLSSLMTKLDSIISVLGSNGGESTYEFTAQINRRTIFDEIINEAKLRRNTSGNNPFELA